MHQLYELVTELSLALNTDLGDMMACAIGYQDWDGLKQLHVPTDLDPESFWRHSQVKELLLKMEGLPGAPSERQLEDSCLAEFYRCEALNKASNSRIKHILDPDMAFLRSDSDERMRSFLLRIRKEIAGLLTGLPDIEGLNTRFGPGATFCLRFPNINVAEKLNSAPSYTLDSWPFLLDWIGTAWGKAVYREDDGVFPGGFTPKENVSVYRLPERVRGNRWTSVPKNSFKRRGICVEPSLNVFYQLGYGSYLRDRLKAVWRIDLRRGQTAHRSMAREGSLRGDLVTIDLSSASDLICRNAVRYLFPPRWVSLLESLRSPCTRVRGKWVHLEKFSSMGNGFTFELETVLFHAIVRVCSREIWPDIDPTELVKNELMGQYGDDCIVPKEHAELVLSVFRFLGFEVNEKKTFLDGPFRESCGGDYHTGVDVRTFKLTELPDAPEKWISFANGLWSVANPNNHHPSRLAFIRRLHRWCLGNIPSHLRRLKGPEHLGDLVVHGFEADWQTPLRWGGCEYYKGYLPVSNLTPWDHFPPCVVLAAALVGSSSDGCPWHDPPVKGYRVRWIGKPRTLRVIRGVAEMKGFP